MNPEPFQGYQRSRETDQEQDIGASTPEPGRRLVEDQRPERQNGRAGKGEERGPEHGDVPQVMGSHRTGSVRWRSAAEYRI